MSKEIFDLYKIPRKAALLLKDNKLRTQTFKKIVSEHNINRYGFGERMEINDMEADYIDEELCQMLGYLTLCTTDKKCSTGSYGVKHHVENLIINGSECYVPNGIAIISVLMCDGKVKCSDGLNGNINIKEPRLCGCDRLISYSRKNICSICRNISYNKRPASKHPIDSRRFDDIVVKSLKQFPPKSDILST